MVGVRCQFVKFMGFVTLRNVAKLNILANT